MLEYGAHGVLRSVFCEEMLSLIVYINISAVSIVTRFRKGTNPLANNVVHEDSDVKSQIIVNSAITCELYGVLLPT